MALYTILQENYNYAHQHRRKAISGCPLPGGESVAEICTDTGVPRSTFYTWIKPYTVTMTDSGHALSQQAFIKMKQKLQKLEQKIEILQKVNCTVSAPLQEKLQELAKLHGKIEACNILLNVFSEQGVRIC